MLPTQTLVEQAARDVVRGRAGAGAAVGARHAVDAAARRHLGCARVRPDARARRAAAARLRPRLRPVGPRRLAGPAHDDRETGASRVLATHGHAEPLARYPARAAASKRRHPDGVGRRGRRGRLRMKRFAAPLRGDRSHHVHQRQGRGDGALLRRGAAGGRGLGGVLPHRPPTEAPRARRGDRRLGDRRHRPRAMAAVASATRSSATARKPRR